jgi:steroid 5-alpha reductase family enzyme
MVFFGLYPTYYALQEENSYNPELFFLGVFVAIAGVTFEAIADMQLQPWRSNKSTDYIDVGLWRYSRHPNYFGECTFWWGTFFQALAFGSHLWFTVVGAVYMQLLFLFYSIPVMEKHLLAKRPSYAEQ